MAAMSATRRRWDDASYVPRYFSKAARYGRAVGRVMVREVTFLSRQQVERMIGLDMRGTLEVIGETVYGPYLKGATEVHEIDKSLLDFLVDEYRFMDEVCAGTLVAEFMHLKYDFHNLKVLLRRNRLASEAEQGVLLDRLGSIDIGAMTEAVERGGMTVGVPEFLTRTIDRVDAAIEAHPDPQVIDTVVDRSYLERRLVVAREERSRPLEGFCEAAIDLANLRVILRGYNIGKPPEFYEMALARGGKLDAGRLAALAGKPGNPVLEMLMASGYGKMLEKVLPADGTVRLTSLDRESDEFLLSHVRGLSRVSVGPERIVRFMLTREDEVMILRVILMGKIHRLTPEFIAGRIPEGYLYETQRQR